jgi:Ca2+-binding RTX toxin-like protein
VLESGASGTLDGLGGDDILTGADGSDILIGDEGNDTLTDLYDAGDELYGGNGNDRLVISSGFTGVLDGGSGTDTVDLSQSNEANGVAFATSGSNMVVDFPNINVTVTAQNIENAIGTDHEDTFNINRSASIDGGDGDDTLLISSSEAVTVNMMAKKAQNSEMTVSFDNVENFTLTSHDDTFIGTMDAGTVNMGSGNDTADYSELTSGLTITQSNTEVTVNNTTTIKGLETLIGSKCNDTINVNSSTSTMAFDGDSGTDKLSFANLNPATNDGIFIDMDSNGAMDDDGFYTALGNNSVTGTGTGALGSVEVKFKSIETFHLTSGDDTFVGSDADETIIANGGHDDLDGKGGKDTFVFDDNDNTASVNGGDIDEGNVIDLTGISGDLSITLSGEGEGSFTLPSASGDVNFTAISDFKLSGTNSTTFVGSNAEESVWLNGGSSNDIDLGDGDDFLQINQVNAGSVGFLNGSDGEDKLAFNSNKITGVNIDITSEGFQVVSEDNGLSGVINIALFEDFSLTDGNDYDTGAYTGGDDTMDGGQGIDTLKVEVDIGLSASIDLDDGTLTVLDAGQQTTQSTSEIENFELYILGDGDDTFVGSGEDDYVIGGKGNDTLTGNDGADSFAFSIDTIADNTSIQNLGLDTVTDFEKDLDKIALNLELFDYDDTGFTIVSTVDTDGVENSSYGSGHGVVMREIDGDTQLWYYDNLSDTSSGGYQFATLSDVTDMDASDIRTYTSNEDLMGQTSGSMQSAVTAAGGVLPA